jgi:DNA-binding IclR family transcriptional regulator
MLQSFAVSPEPSKSFLHIAYRAGLRHPLNVAAPGLPIVAANPPIVGERAEVTRARERGWARSSGELLTDATGVAVAITTGRNEPDTAISAVWIAEHDEEETARRIMESARRLAESPGRSASPPARQDERSMDTEER